VFIFNVIINEVSHPTDVILHFIVIYIGRGGLNTPLFWVFGLGGEDCATFAAAICGVSHLWIDRATS
jgi:hypothetical protein